MKPCGLNCPTCPYIEPGTVIQSSNTRKKIEINGTFNCKTRNVVYCITVNSEQCKLQYIGQTTRSLDERVREHIGYIRNLHTNHTNQPTGVHFNLPGHELYYLKVSVLEKVYKLKSLFLIFMTETISRNNNFLKTSFVRIDEGQPRKCGPNIFLVWSITITEF